MELVKEVEGVKIYKKRSGRYAAKDANRQWLKGDAKAELLQKQGFISLPKPKAKPEAPAAEGAESESAEK